MSHYVHFLSSDATARWIIFILSTFDKQSKTQLLAKFKKVLYVGFIATLTFRNFKVALNPTYKSCVLLIFHENGALRLIESTKTCFLFPNSQLLVIDTASLANAKQLQLTSPYQSLL